MKFIDGGITAPKGFMAGGMHCGIRPNKKKPDLMMLKSEVPCNAAGVYTSNLVKGASIEVCKKHLTNGIAQAVIANSGNANTCNSDGVEKAEKMAEAAASALKIKAQDVLVASTGVIGQPLPIEPIIKASPVLAKKLSKEGGDYAAKALMTTDTVPKNLAVEFMLGDNVVRLGGVAKGSGMIHPNMCTMLCFLTTDAAISTEALESALQESVKNSFNMISVDGDTSTNDTCCIMANGLAKNEPITTDGEDYQTFLKAMKMLCTALCKMMAKDGEGATKLLACRVTGASSDENARIVAKTIICSSLVKAAMFGSDANWGRVLCAIGYSGVPVDIHAVDVAFRSKMGAINVCKDGAGIDFDEEIAKKILLEDEIGIDVTLHDGDFEAIAYGCDLTYDYVKINGDYRT
ncbi:MAG: bifunctional glutamate N-acetyltransferase/amino-acid acetyltransferase ArgJ [Oscillospiraceae bacterium]|jgi:glutamate N-acetyltransferase/amino-acid N-acetyltransferase|nr:bifunctional glutamate N-acetyltransferase/amino-acid acetyltransferase ArgJ [Oscillospiraceae bacterium]